MPPHRSLCPSGKGIRTGLGSSGARCRARRPASPACTTAPSIQAGDQRRFRGWRPCARQSAANEPPTPSSGLATFACAWGAAALRQSAASGWGRRWGGLLAVAVQQVVGTTALGQAWPTTAIGPAVGASPRPGRLRASPPTPAASPIAS